MSALSLYAVIDLKYLPQMFQKICDCVSEHPLRTISYIADIANIIVIMARRIPAFNTPSEQQQSNNNNNDCEAKGEEDEASQQQSEGAEGQASQDETCYEDQQTQYANDLVCPVHTRLQHMRWRLFETNY